MTKSSKAWAESVELDPHDVAGQDDITFVDLRQSNELVTGMIPGAIHHPYGGPGQAPMLDYSNPVVLYCASGQRSLAAANEARVGGADAVWSLRGGIAGWVSAGLEVANAEMTAETAQRYGRQMNLPGFGAIGQSRLAQSSAVIVGAGGLGSSVAMYLAGAGVGKITVVDHDVVEVSNLHRQLLHNNDRLGQPKVHSARQTIQQLNPDVEVVAIEDQLTSSNVETIINGADVVMDCTDQLAVKPQLANAARRLQVPVVHASVDRFQGMLLVVPAIEGRCYSCVFPVAPPPGLIQTCNEAGVTGPVVGVVGSWQAHEALTLLLDCQPRTQSTLLTIDLKRNQVDSLDVTNCALCGPCESLRR